MSGWSALCDCGIAMELAVNSFEGNRVAERAASAAAADGRYGLKSGRADWMCDLSLLCAEDGILKGSAIFNLERGAEPCGNVSVTFHFNNWSTGNYVLMPAAVYDGNRFRSVKKSYPPFIHEEDGIGPDMPVTITDVPRLNESSGASQIHLRSGDMSTPCLGVFIPSSKQGVLLLFEHITDYGYTGLKLKESGDRKTAAASLEAPAVRERKYTMCSTETAADDAGAAICAGDTIALRFEVVLFDCESVASLFEALLRHRKRMCGTVRMVHGLPFSSAYRIIERKFNETQYNDRYGYYKLCPDGTGGMYGDWQPGWCGCGMSSLALLYNGNPLSRERANQTVDAVFGILQHESGFPIPFLTDGIRYGDDFCHQKRQNVLMVRKAADLLVFSARHVLLTRRRGESVPPHWLKGLRKMADAFVRLWNRYSQFGQFIDIGTEAILIGGTAAGSMAPGGLALACSALGDGRYLQTAEESARYYHSHYVEKGLLNGGPGEILQCPDSESASNMLESFVILYETTGCRDWLRMAEETAWQCASWCVPYDFVFPSCSTFGRLGMHTAGSVFANVQNKHSAPGFCTLSGASLLRLYRATGDRRYLDLCMETAHNITQYLSRSDRPIPTWDGPDLPPGWMCERVNMSDWEGRVNIGGVFYGSCWCEVSCLLTYAEIPGIWFLCDTGEAIAFDHVEVTVTDAGDCWELQIFNPTQFDADVKLLCETRLYFSVAWDQCIGDDCQMLKLAACRQASVKVCKYIDS